MSKKIIARLLGPGLAISLIGCVLPPKEAPHPSAITDTSMGLEGPAVAPAPDGWWKSFDDAQLDALVDHTLTGNPSLAQASARLREAVAQADAAHAGLLPKVDSLATAQRLLAPKEFIIPPPLAGHYIWTGVAGANLSWDLDFWGKQANAIAEARAYAKAANLEIADTHLLLAGALSQAYVELYRSHVLIDIASQSEAQRQHILDITRQRVGAGLDTRLELREAESLLPQARIERMQAQAAVDLAVHQLAMISGQGAEAYASIKRPELNLDAILPLPSTLPINLLARRPDVMAARFRVEAADARRRASKAAFYPDISITALAGFGSFGLNTLFKAGSFGYGGGPLITLPIFDAGKLRAQYRGSEAALDLAMAGYNDTVLKAVQQTADQLTRIAALSGERDDQKATLDAAEDGYRIAEERYRAGLAGYLSVLNAQTQVLGARRQSVDIATQLADARITLLLALGGSYDASAAAGSVSAKSGSDRSTPSLLQATPQATR